MSPGWPAVLTGACAGSEVVLRPLRPRADRVEWFALRAANADWTQPWEPTPVDAGARPFGAWVRAQHREGLRGRALPFVLQVDGRLAGQVQIFGIEYGALRSGVVGYWINRRLAGRGLMPYAVGLLIDHTFSVVGLHRVEINIRVDNAASLRVVEKLRLREEGLRTQYLRIDGEWRDHRSFAVTQEDRGIGLLTDRLGTP